jgi:hypothetical protein
VVAGFLPVPQSASVLATLLSSTPFLDYSLNPPVAFPLRDFAPLALLRLLVECRFNSEASVVFCHPMAFQGFGIALKRNIRQDLGRSGANTFH